MNRKTKVKNILVGLLMILGSLLILFVDDGYYIVFCVLALSLMVMGIGKIVYFFTMTRYMVGGEMTLYLGVIILDLGMFAGSMTDVDKIYIMIYLMISLIFSGAIDIMRAFEAKKLDAPSWKVSLGHGIVCVVLPIASFFLADYVDLLVYAYVISICYSGAVRIASAFKKTAVAYIQ